MSSLPSENPSEQPNAASIGALFSRFSDQISHLFRGEIALAKAEAGAKVKKLGVGGAMFAVAGVLALYGLGILFLAAVWGIATALPLWASALIVAGVIFLICAILVLIGKKKLDASKAHTIDPKTGLNKSLDAVKKGFNQ